MTQPIGEEFVRIRPDASGFAAELQAQVAAALRGVQPQLAAARTQLTRTAAGSATLGGLPSSVQAATLAQTNLGTATQRTKREIDEFARTSTRSSGATRNLQRDIHTAETAAGRYTRGMFAATAASTGFFRAVSFASGAFLVGALAGGAIASAVQEFRDATIVGARLAAVLKATGDSAGLTAGQIDALAQRQLRLTGIDDELVKSEASVLATFRSIRDQVGQGNQVFTRAVKDVQDISAVFGTALTGSAVQLGKALQDPIRGVTALRRSGITLSQSQRDLIKRLVETGRILSAQKIILGEVERQVGGTAKAIGQTLPGQLNILKESAKNALGEYVKRVSESEQASELAAQASLALGQTFGALRDVVKTLGPPLLVTAQALGRATQAVGGVGTLLAAAAAYKAVTISVSLAAAAQRVYARAALVGAGATAAETRAVATSAATFRVQAASSSTAALGTAAAKASVGLRALRIGTAALGGPIGIAALGVAALTVAIIKLRQSAQNAPGTLNATKRALDDLSDAVARAARLQNELAGQRENVSIANFNVQAAQRDVTRARGAQARSTAAPGSLEAVHLTNAVTAAEQKLTQANRELATAQRQADITAGQLAANERSRQFVIANTTKGILDQIAALKLRARQQQLSPQSEAQATTPVATQALERFDALLTRLAKSGKPIERQVGGALEAIRTVIDKIPSEKQIAFVVRAIGRGMTTNQALALLTGGGLATGIGREAGTEGIRARGLAGAPTPSAAEEQQFLAAKALLNTERARLKVLRETAAKRNEELQTQQQSLRAAKDAVANAREGLTAAIEGLAAARQALADTIRSSREAVNQAVQDAKSNLDTLGQAVADTLQKFREEGSKVLGGGKLGANFQALKQQILAGGGGPETQRAAQQLSNRLTAQQPPDTSKLSQGFADLTDKLNRGRLTLPQFNRQLAALLKGLDFRAFRQQFGTAAANLLRDQIAALRKQARLVTEAPQRRGGGAQQTLVNPLRAVAQGARDIAAAQKDVVKARAAVVSADHDLTEAINDLRRAEVRERRANTVATKANSRVIQQLVDVMKAEQSLRGGGKKKPKGDAGKVTTENTSAGANAP